MQITDTFGEQGARGDCDSKAPLTQLGNNVQLTINRGYSRTGTSIAIAYALCGGPGECANIAVALGF